MIKQDDSVEPKISFRKVLTIYFKASRKRIISMLIISTIFFLILTSIVLISFSIYQNSFYSYIETNHDWLKDNKISVRSGGSIEDSKTLDSNYLMKGINEVKTQLENIIPNIQKRSAGVIEISLFNFITYNSYFDIILSTFDDISLNLIENNLHSGRLPENSTEILYYNVFNQSSYGIGDIFNITTDRIYNSYPIITKCQIVGIVNNLESIYYNNNISTDILREIDNYFITTSTFFYEFVNEIENKDNGLDVLIDFDYTFSVKHLKTNKYLRALDDYSNWNKDKSFEFLPNPNPFHFCDDLLQALIKFKIDWYLTIFYQLLIASPLMFLFGFISVEIYRTGNYDKRAKYRLLKTYGMDNKSLSKFLFLENLILLGSSLLFGLCLSLFVDYFIVRSLNLTPNVSYIAGFSNLSSILVISFLFLAIFTINYIIDLVQLRKTKVTVMEQYKIKKKRFLSKIFSLPELNFLVPGLIFAIFGLLILYLEFDDAYNWIDNMLSFYFYIIFSLMAFLGILFLLMAILLFLRRGMIYLWSRIGGFIWKNTKSYFSLAIRQLSVYINDYKNTLMVIFLIGLTISPGLVISKSVELHNTLEANLSVGCTDILVENWDIDGNLESNISRIDGVELSTVLSNIAINMEGYSVFDDSKYYLNLYVVNNITEFIEIVNFTLLKQDGYSKNDIVMLETDLTYLMNRKFARTNGFNRNKIFTTVGITPSIYEPKELIYINDFSYFPLIPRRKFEGQLVNDIFNQPKYIDLVVSNNTKDLILEYSGRERNQEDYLLIKTTEGANITAINEELSSEYHLTANSLEDYITNLDNKMNFIGLKLYLIISILAVMLIIIYGCFKATNLFKERQRILEIFIQNGARRWFIMGLFSIEFILVLLVPLIVTVLIPIPILTNFSSFLLNLVTEYNKFTLWYPWWIAVLTGLIALFSVLIGWFTILYPFIKKYRLSKHE
ncbi:MAG: FtsX-like permease family protein [Asgard group archaeon]|nr:FtsX-like permease family protein [Asgard group archaeon]